MSTSAGEWGITRLPTDCLTEVFTFLDHRTVFLNVSCTCDDWRSMLQDKCYREFWVGRICSKLCLPNTGDASGWVETAVLDNGDMRISPTYFLLVHYIEKLLRGCAPVMLGTGTFARDVQATEVGINRSIFAKCNSSNYHARILPEVFLSDVGVGIKAELEPDELSNERLYIQRSVVNDNYPLFVVGKELLGVDCSGLKRRLPRESPRAVTTKVATANPMESALESFVASDASTECVAMSPFLFITQNCERDYRTRCRWVASSCKPWGSLDQSRKVRSALAAIFNIMSSQGLLNGKSDNLFPVLQRQWETTGLLTMESLLSCVLDCVGLRCLLHFRASGYDQFE